MLDQIVALDTELLLYLNNLGTTTFDGFWQFITNKKSWIPLYVVLLIVLYREFGWKQTLLILALVGLMIGCTDQITNFLKEDWVKRLRPCFTEGVQDQIRLLKKTCGGKYGFTSAHSSNHFAIAIFVGSVLRFKYKWLLGVLLIWAALIAYSRVYIGVHFPLDIFFGSLLGVLFSLLFIGIYHQILKKWEHAFKS